MKPQKNALEELYNSLPFELTGAQKRAVEEIEKDPNLPLLW